MIIKWWVFSIPFFHIQGVNQSEKNLNHIYLTFRHVFFKKNFLTHPSTSQKHIKSLHQLQSVIN